jgi:hypothetical protein
MATKIVIKAGVAVSVYDDRFAPIYAALGLQVEITRASDVEFDHDLRKWVAVECASGKVIASGDSRGEVIRAEIVYLERGL